MSILLFAAGCAAAAVMRLDEQKQHKDPKR